MNAFHDLTRAFAAVVVLAVANTAILPRVGYEMAAIVLEQPEQGAGAEGAMGTGVEERVLQIAIQQGGLLVVLLVVLFFYRRDSRDLDIDRKATIGIITNLVKEHTQAATELAAVMRENTVVVHHAKRILAEKFPDRREDEGRRR